MMNSKSSLIPLFLALIFFFFVFDSISGNVSCHESLYGNMGRCYADLTQCQQELEDYFKNALSITATGCQVDGDYHVCYGIVGFNANECPP